MFVKIKKFFGSSIFVKILAIFLIAHIVFSFTMALTRDYIFKNFHAKRIYDTAYNYSKILIDEIGMPPDTAKASRLANDFQIDIRIQNDTLRWASNNNTPRFRNLDLTKYEKAPDTYVGFDDGLHVKSKIGETSFLISVEKNRKDFLYFDEILFFLNLFIFTIILFFIYFILKRQLKPISVLKKGVEKIGRGNFDTRIETNSHDELGKLVNSFNEMSHSVNQMIIAREQLMRDVSHELRSPLTRVKIALEFMEEGKTRKSIQSDIKEIETMITEILETERLKNPYGVLSKEKIDLTNLLKEIQDEFSDRRPGINFEGKGSFELMGDATRLKIVFRNLFENSLKYSENQNKPVEVRLNHSREEIVYTQKDYGIGIPKDEIENIFEPFYRVDKSRTKKTGGYGLGLHLSKNIIEAHSGKIDIESKIDEGTIFIIRLPKN